MLLALFGLEGGNQVSLVVEELTALKTKLDVVDENTSNIILKLNN